MTNPTTPFSWQMPTSSDLVTDLPADFETFGQAVATSMADLLGGTTGQILSKASNTDMDFTWTSPNPGDITAVTAGTGISGGGTSGDVTITNSMATAIDAKGDLIAGTGADAFSRLAVGANNTILTADSSTATGLKWATPASGGGLTFIKSQTIGSAVSSVTVTDAFSATYDNYLITFSDGSASGAGTGALTLGATTSAYYMSGFYLSPTGSSVTGFNINNGASWSATYYTTSNNGGHIILQSPFLSKRTTFQSVLIGADSGSNYAHYFGHLQNTTSYTAFTLTASGGTTMTGGTIRVYGYQNS